MLARSGQPGSSSWVRCHDRPSRVRSSVTRTRSALEDGGPGSFIALPRRPRRGTRDLLGRPVHRVDVGDLTGRVDSGSCPWTDEAEDAAPNGLGHERGRECAAPSPLSGSPHHVLDLVGLLPRNAGEHQDRLHATDYRIWGPRSSHAVHAVARVRRSNRWWQSPGTPQDERVLEMDASKREASSVERDQVVTAS